MKSVLKFCKIIKINLNLQSFLKECKKNLKLIKITLGDIEFDFHNILSVL